MKHWEDLTAEEQQDAIKTIQKNLGGYWSSHPRWPVDEWAQSVATDETRLGYWEWVYSGLYEETELQGDEGTVELDSFHVSPATTLGTATRKTYSIL